ncbi:hypothetical protein QF023_003701 [Chryseobacterium sp. SLBN-27]|nr:hypothetical protein [Chryseobacterium sp. SLBN-27]
MVKIISNLKKLFDLNNYQHDIIAGHMKLFTMISCLYFRIVQYNSIHFFSIISSTLALV